MTSERLSRKSAAFALAAAIVILFNTILACAKDANLPLKKFMASLAGHDWTTQGIVDLLLFIALGLILSKFDCEKAFGSNRLISLLAGTAIVAGLGLAAWYILY